MTPAETSFSFNESYRVGSDAHLGGSVKISGNAVVYQGAYAVNAVQVSENAQVFGNVNVGTSNPDACAHDSWGSQGSPKVHGNAKICGNTDFTGTLSTCDKRYCSECP